MIIRSTIDGKLILWRLVSSPVGIEKQKAVEPKWFSTGSNGSLVVGARGFEPPTPCSQSRYASQAALRPEYLWLFIRLSSEVNEPNAWYVLFSVVLLSAVLAMQFSHLP